MGFEVQKTKPDPVSFSLPNAGCRFLATAPMSCLPAVMTTDSPPETGRKRPPINTSIDCLGHGVPL